jgi:protein-tyrosine phosphatase
MSFVTSRFGTARGLVRLALSYGEVALGRAAVVAPEPADVRRLVFVCHGNICRSAFADVAAQSMGLRTASFGLSTDAGRLAYPSTVAVAQGMGYDLRAHRAAQIENFVPECGDLLLAMETRQLRRLAEDPVLGAVPRTLLGLYANPAFPHLHDPYDLDAAYMPICLGRIENAVANLAKTFPGARLSG